MKLPLQTRGLALALTLAIATVPHAALATVEMKVFGDGHVIRVSNQGIDDFRQFVGGNGRKYHVKNFHGWIFGGDCPPGTPEKTIVGNGEFQVFIDNCT